MTAKAWVRGLALMREAFDGDSLFSVAGWSILLDLYVSRWEGRQISVSSACLASRLPPTTTLRYLDYLIDLELISKGEHPTDGRSHLVATTKKGLVKMTAALDAATKSNERFGMGHLRLVK